jgi:hypothetical protein
MEILILKIAKKSFSSFLQGKWQVMKAKRFISDTTASKRNALGNLFWCFFYPFTDSR